MQNDIKKQIAIIGAGPSGLAQLLAFKKAAEEQLVELVCFERQLDWGGLWQYTALTGVDTNGEPVHSSMYRQLWSNGPKEILEFTDYSFEKHFGHPIPSYPPRAVIYDYITGRAQAGDIRKYIRFNTAVRHVDFDSTIEKFQVTVEELGTQKLDYFKFDHVIVATGHYSVPNVPHFQGLSKFPGRVAHSHDYRGADEFLNQNILIIGSGYSAEDIAMQCHKFGVKSVTISHRSCPMNYKWPSNIREVPLLERIENRKAYFKDGSCADDLDSIILCTGYRHQHSYMAENLRLRLIHNANVPPNLYKGIFWVTQPRLAYLGMHNQTYTFTMFDAQAALVRDVYLGIVKLPAADDESARRKDIAEWEAREAPLTSADHEAAADLQTEYIKDVLSLCDQSTAPYFDFERATVSIYKFFDDKRKDISTYRDQPYDSIFPPYKKAPVTNKPWLKAMDDTISGYFATIQN